MAITDLNINVSLEAVYIIMLILLSHSLLHVIIIFTFTRFTNIFLVIAW